MFRFLVRFLVREDRAGTLARRRGEPRMPRVIEAMGPLRGGQTLADVPESVAAAFRGRCAAPASLGPGVELDRALTAVVSRVSSDFWMLGEDTDAAAAACAANGTSLRDYLRARCAILEGWNPNMDQLVRVRLLRRVHAMVGACAPQAERRGNGRGAPFAYIGGHRQVYCPGLNEGEHYRVVRRFELR